MKTTHAASVLFLAIAAALPAQGPAKVTLRYAFEAGKVGYSVMNQSMSMKMNMGGRSMDTTMTSSIYSTTTIKEVKDGVATVELKIDRAKMQGQVPMAGKVNYDSDDPDSEPNQMAKGLADLVGKTMVVVVDTAGNVKEAKIPEEMKAAAQGMDLEHMVQGQYTQLPKDAIAVGGKWDTEMEMPMGQMGNTKVKIHNRLDKVEGGKATIAQELEMDLEGIQAPQGMKMKLEKATGSLVMGVGSWLLPENTMDMTMTMTGGGEGGAPKMDMSMGMKTESKATDAPKKKDAAKKDEAKKDEAKGEGKK